MIEEKLSLHDPIVALATPLGKSAIAVIRTSGEGVIERLDPLFSGRKRLAEQKGYMIARGDLKDPGTGETLDQVLAAVFRSPHSYTGEDMVEIYSHGGIPTVVRLLKLIRARGFRDAAPGEFTLRAFRNGKMDLTEAEAVNEIVNARSDRARALALTRLSGALFQKIDAMKQKLADILSGIEVMIDYPDETYEHKTVSGEALVALIRENGELVAGYRVGKIIQEGVTVVIAGKTNSGKSTLFNLLLKEDRSIVSDFHGTTRDFIEAPVTVAGIPLRLFDTAGLRDSDQPLEQEGIRRTGRLLKEASLVLYLVDAIAGLTAEDRSRLETVFRGRPVIRLWNKIDQGGTPAPDSFLPFSAVTGAGFPELEEAIRRVLLGDFPLEGEAVVIDSLRQKEALEKARLAMERARDGLTTDVSYDLVAEDLKEAVDALGLITGEVTSADILERMFSRFCVGK